MFYKYKPFKVDGVNGYTVNASLNDGDTRLGVIEEWTFIHSTADALGQDVRIEFQGVILTQEEKELLKAQLPHKEFARMKVEDIGDVYDLIADAMKLIEFNMMLTARLAGDMWGTNPIAEDKKALYAARNKGFLDAVEAGAITLRGDFDDMDALMTRLMSRYSQINEVVRDVYVSELKRVGL